MPATLLKNPVTVLGFGAARRSELFHGDEGTVESLLSMRDMIRAAQGLDGGTFSERLYTEASNALFYAGVPAHNDLATIKAIHAFVIANVKYREDPAGGEFLESPEYVLERGYDDCDGLVTLEASLLGMAGIINVSLEAAKYEADADGAQHVYLYVEYKDANDEQTFIYLDPTADDKPPGWHLEHPLEWLRLSVFDDTPLSTGIGGFWSTLATIGGAVAAPFTAGQSLWVTAAVSGASAAGRVAGQAADTHAAKGKAEKEAGKQFDALAGQTTQLFDAIEHKAPGTITLDDYNAANAEYGKLADIVAQYGSKIPYIQAQWNTPSYNETYKARLAEIQAAATVAASQRQTDSSASAGSASDSAQVTIPLIGTTVNVWELVAVVAGLYAVLK